MFYCDKNGLVWKQEGDVFRNVGISVVEREVTFRRIEKINVTMGVITVPSISNAIPLTVREAIKKLDISEQSPLEPLKQLNMEVFKNEQL